MDYIGSKTKLNNWIFNELSKYVPKNEWINLCFMDGCAGSCAVSKHALRQGFKVISIFKSEKTSPLVGEDESNLSE